jgi:Domain of unknown function (DUF5916)/Carbohydrate family 9 binding domain-like
MKKTYITLIISLLCIAKTLNAQTTTTQKDFKLNIKKAIQSIKIDGSLEESDWKDAQIATGFQVHYPQNGATPKFQTEARITYDDHFLYVGFVCYDTGKHIIQTLKRDIDYFSSEGMAIIIDPAAQQTNGFMFGVSTEGVQSDALLGSDGDPSFEWDNKWFAEVKKGIDRWTAELAIPFKTLRYESSRTTWNINFVRNYPKSGNFHTWTKVPQQFDGISLAYTGSMDWDKNPPSEKSNIALIPYTSGSVSKDYEKGKNTEGVLNAGLDAKVALSSSLNLDVTLNPDFSQVEVDEQVTNLTRFNVIFPEKRTFFLENSDVLSAFGIPPARPFFSRTIGLNADAQPVPILYGVRLSGNLTNKMRVNALNMHTRERGTGYGQNYSAVAFQQNIVGRSYIKVGFLNRQGFDSAKISAPDYGRNLLLSGVYVSKNNNVEAWAEGHKSFKPNITGRDWMTSNGFLWRNKNWEIVNDLTRIGENYYADMGLVNRLENRDDARDTTIRLGITQLFTEINYFKRPQKGNITEHFAGYENFMVWNPDGSLNEWFKRLRYFFTFKNTSELKFRLDNSISNVPFPFQFDEENALLEAKHYNYTYGVVQFDSDGRKKWSWNVKASAGEFYNGSRIGIQGGLKFRAQPWGNFSLNVDWNRVKLPAASEKFDGITTPMIISPKTEINFSRTMFWTTWFQYNTQGNNFNINSRFQWRFRPMSDLFVVYTDNYFVNEEERMMTPTQAARLFRPFDVKNRALVFKLNYWLNL